MNPRLSTLTFVAIATLSSTAAGETVRRGEEIFKTHCGACHGSGWNDAPVAGIKEDWQPRLAKGFDVMFANVKRGMGAMPAMGACMECSDAELKAAIEEMIKF